MEGYISEVRLFAGNFAPRSWSLCAGQLIPIRQNTALFSLIGTLYGGDGRTTCGLPNLVGRTAVGVGQGPGMAPIDSGETGGTTAITLTVENMASHQHLFSCTGANANVPSPANAIPAAEPAPQGDLWSNATATGTMAATMLAPTGNNAPFANREPYLGLCYIICVNGIFPSRAA